MLRFISCRYPVACICVLHLIRYSSLVWCCIGCHTYHNRLLEKQTHIPLIFPCFPVSPYQLRYKFCRDFISSVDIGIVGPSMSRRWALATSVSPSMGRSSQVSLTCYSCVLMLLSTIRIAICLQISCDQTNVLVSLHDVLKFKWKVSSISTKASPF